MALLHQRKRSKKSKHDNWWTPLKLFIFLCKLYKFKPILDVSATENNTKCKYFFTKKTNALKRRWKIKRKKHDVWCNPPNSLLGKFIRKAYEEFKKGGIRIMMIVPANAISSKAWWECIEEPRDRKENVFYKPILGRQNFLERGREPKFSARNAYLVVIWGKKPRI